MLFGIQLTPGHIILAFVSVIAYDAIWTWLFPNTTSEWWFERIQGLLKTGIYAGFLALGALVAYTPSPWNLVIALSAAVSAICIAAWLRRRIRVITGTLQIMVTGLPTATSPDIIATGPVNRTAHGPAILVVPIGTYTVTASAIDTLIPTVTGSPVIVTADATANVTVAYA